MSFSMKFNNDLVYNDDDVYLIYFDCQDLFSVYNISYII